MIRLYPFDTTYVLYVLFYQINSILLIDFNLVTCFFFKFVWFKMFNGYVDVTFNMLSLRMTFVLVQTLEN